jgi:negative regulator of flagellin synthesis FlgM
MKINQINQINQVGKAYQAYQKNSGQPKKTSGVKKVQFDQVELSTEAQKQLQVEKDTRIEQLKKQIESGTYRVDGEKIAEKLVAFWKSGAKIDE